MHDLILLGGGLANSLIALRLRALRPELRLLLVEGGPVLGARHTWSFFDTDVSPEQRGWLQPLIVHRWPGYSVRFPGKERRLGTPTSRSPPSACTRSSRPPCRPTPSG